MKHESTQHTICVVGLGHIGLPCALCAAANGNRVMGFDNDPILIEKLNNKLSPFLEPGVSELLAETIGRSFFPTSNFKEALNEAFILDSEPFIIGGQSIYEAAMPYADRIFLTVTKKDYEGDRYFPKYVDDPAMWRKTKIRENEDAEFYLLERISEQYML